MITECEEIATGLRRDLVCLTCGGEIFEFETDVSRAVRFIPQAVNVIAIGWKFSDKKWVKAKSEATSIKVKEYAEHP